MKFFSMFTGVGGFEIGIQRAFSNRHSTNDERKGSENIQDLPNSERNDVQGAVQCVGYSEIDKFACKVMREKHPEVQNYGDATRIQPEQLPDFDLLVGGFPCQAFSIAGARKGFEDSRGTLFYDIARIARAKRPEYLLLENVKGLVNHEKGKTLSVILSTFQELGYSLEWGVCNSRYFGVPQNRERIFVIGRLGRGSGRKVFPQLRTDEEDTRKNKGLIYLGSTREKDWVGDGKKLSRNSPEGYRVYSDEGINPTLRSQLGGHAKGSGIIAQAVLTPDRKEKRQNGRRMKKPGEPSFTITQQDIHGVAIKTLNNPKHSQQRIYSPEGLAPTIAAGNNGGGKEPCKIAVGTLRTHKDGNGFREVKSGNSPTIPARAREDGSGQPVIKQETRIRRLTPRECERLQGFPDDWTKYGREEDGTRVEISDTQRYKQMGNAVSVPVVAKLIEIMLYET